MQKKLIALAVAGLASTGAFAQVSLYGVADVYFGAFSTEGAAQAASNGALVCDATPACTPVVTAATNASTAKRNAIGSGLLSGSRIGFTAEEDLGDGIKAVARLENAITIDSNSTAGLWGITRQAYVGLDTGAGRFSLGRQYSPGYFAALASDGVAGAAFGTQSILTLNSGATITPNSGARVDNSFNWVSKPMGPVSFNVLYGLGEDNKDDADSAPNKGKAGNILAGGAQFKMAGLTADVVVSNKNLDDTNKQKEMFIGAGYNFGVATVGASYQTNEMEVAAVTALTARTDRAARAAAAAYTRKDKIANVSVIVPVGKGNIHAAYGKLSSDRAAEDGQKSMSIGYTHAMGKRTTLYAAYNQTKRDTAGTISTVGIQDKAEKASVLAAGMRLTF